MSNLIERQAAIDLMISALNDSWEPDYAMDRINELPSAQPEHTNCTYCHEDFDGYVYPIEKNCHAWISRERLIMSAKGWKKEIKINYCPMCGRRLTNG